MRRQWPATARSGAWKPGKSKGERCDHWAEILREVAGVQVGVGVYAVCLCVRCASVSMLLRVFLLVLCPAEIGQIRSEDASPSGASLVEMSKAKDKSRPYLPRRPTERSLYCTALLYVYARVCCPVVVAWIARIFRSCLVRTTLEFNGSDCSHTDTITPTHSRIRTTRGTHTAPPTLRPATSLKHTTPTPEFQ
jgi:hypothetical protein